MDKTELIQKVQEMTEAPTCCRDLKTAAAKWKDSIGTSSEKENAEALIQELKEDVMPIDGVISFGESDFAVSRLGKEKAGAIAAHAKEVKESGGKYCDCAACTAGLWILNHQDLLG